MEKMSRAGKKIHNQQLQKLLLNVFYVLAMIKTNSMKTDMKK